MSVLAVTGYASVDYAISLSGQAKGDHTTLIGYRDRVHWPRLGGCPAYVASAVAAQDQLVFPISWIGNDRHADIYLDGLASANIGDDGIARLDRPSPMAILAYQADGSCACLFDPAFAGEEKLTARQGELIGSASHLCITVGPPHLMDAILARRSPEARLYWICKNDSHCFTPTVRELLSAQADVIFCSRAERTLIGATGRSAIIIETNGPYGVSVDRGDRIDKLDVAPIEVRDATGAGDTFAGGYIAAELAGADDPVEAVRAGMASVTILLEQRSAREKR